MQGLKSPKPSGEYLTPVQVLRFVAASLVVLGHVKHEAAKTLGIDSGLLWDFAPTALLASGVDMFFVISGFIMFTISAREFGSAGASGRFLLRRLARVVPAYWLFTLAMVAWLLSGKANGAPPAPGAILASLLFLPHYDVKGELYPVLMLGWTLNFEMLFYAIFALGLRLPRRPGLALIVVMVCVPALWGSVSAPRAAPFAFWCHSIVLEFLFGVLLAWVRERGWRLGRGSAWALVIAGFAALILVGHLGASEPLDPRRVLWMGLPAMAICAATTLVSPAKHQSGWLRIGAAAGDASYALYLSHPFVLGAVGAAWRRSGLDLPELFMLIAYATCLGFALVFFRVIERPVTRALNARLSVSRGARSTLRLPAVKEAAR